MNLKALQPLQKTALLLFLLLPATAQADLVAPTNNADPHPLLNAGLAIALVGVLALVTIFVIKKK